MPDMPHALHPNDPAAVERPEPGSSSDTTSGKTYGSDRVADTLRALGIPYVALNPGASFRGLHDSLVNHLGNRDPRHAAVPARGARGGASRMAGRR